VTLDFDGAEKLHRVPTGTSSLSYSSWAAKYI